jgi:two-component system sensor histidine kinase and response regulator WspE
LNKYGICVDKFIGKFDLSVKPLDTRLGKIQNISAGSILDDGSPVVILDVDDLVRTIDSILTQGSLRRIGSHKNIAIAEKKRILVVDDSITVREVERKLLENRGYHVSVAVDGIDGWNSLQSASFDLVISDIDMPRMNGIEFVTRLKQHPEFKGIPVMIVSYKDREEDRIRGLEAGANYYLTKSSFHDESLINAVKDLIGEA